MAYTSLQNGSRGSEVKTLQQTLRSAGYDVGSTGTDGIYGPITEAAVRKYQQDNGLKVDGIAGSETLGSLYGNSNATGTGGQTAAEPLKTPADYSDFAYDPTTNPAYMDALAALNSAKENVPTYAGTWDAQVEDFYNQIVNREKFSYDLNSDALYQQYKDQYTQLGKMAMEDTMGQAATMTGGYGNSYAATAGNQAYQGYLQQLNDKVPEFYGMALDRYNQESEELYDQYALTSDLRDDEYGKYRDSLTDYWNNVTFAKGEADTAYDRGYNSYYASYNAGVAAEEREYQKELDRIAQEQWEKDYKLREEQNNALYGDKTSDNDNKNNNDNNNNNNDNKSTGTYDNEGLNSATIKAMQEYFGVTADGKWGEASKKAAGGLSAKEAWNKWQGVDNENNDVDYSSWGAADWQSYFAQIRQSEGQASAEEELEYFTSNGLIPKNMTSYAASGARGGRLGH